MRGDSHDIEAECAALHAYVDTWQDTKIMCMTLGRLHSYRGNKHSRGCSMLSAPDCDIVIRIYTQCIIYKTMINSGDLWNPSILDTLQCHGVYHHRGIP